MNSKKEVLALSDEELQRETERLLGVIANAVGGVSPHDYLTGLTQDVNLPRMNYPNDIGAAMTDLFESVYGRGGKLKGGAWILGTVEGGRDVASATLLWKAQSGQKHRVHKVTVIRPRGEMAKAITQAWVCGMLGLSDVTEDASGWISDRPGGSG